MKVKLLQPFKMFTHIHKIGEIMDVSVLRGRSFIQAGIAEEFRDNKEPTTQLFTPKPKLQDIKPTINISQRIVIMAAGQSRRWKNYLGVPKQLIPIDDEPIIKRTIRQLKERGIIDIYVTVRQPNQYGDLGIQEYLNIENNHYSIDRIYGARELAPAIFLYGDAYYTENAINIILSDTHEAMFFGRRYPETIKGNREIYAIKANDWVIEKAGELRKLHQEGKVRNSLGQHLHRYCIGVDLYKVTPSDLTSLFVDINDETEDFDKLSDYQNFIKAHKPQRVKGDLTCGFIIRFHYEADDPKFEWRLKYFKEAVLPRIWAQTDRNFDVCIRCNPIHDDIFRELGCKPFHVKKEYSAYYTNIRWSKAFFYDFVKWEDCIDLEQYDIQMGLDSDDLIEPNYVETIKNECKNSKTSLHIHFQPQLYNLKTGEIKPHHAKYNNAGSMFHALYYPDKSEYHHCYEVSHVILRTLAKRSKLFPAGYCFMTIHDANESSGRTFSTQELERFPVGVNWKTIKNIPFSHYVPGSHNTIRAFQWTGQPNVGDTLTTPLLKHYLGVDVKVVDLKTPNKFMVIGSELGHALPGDIVWGSGIHFPEQKTISNVTVLATRGKLAKQYIKGVKLPPVYGDPGLLMPEIYNPMIEKKYKLGIIPHWTDIENHPEGHMISVFLPWKKFINEILACERIISSSLHGIVLAEAYGISVEWAQWGERTKRQYIKFHDYLTGTDRDIQEPGIFPPIPDLKAIQQRLRDALINYATIK